MNIKCLNQNETVDFIIKNKCSTSRFGDGGILNLLDNLDITHHTGVQKSSNALSQKLIEIFYNSKSIKNHLICIPPVFTNTQLEESKRFSKETNSPEKWNYKFNLRESLQIKLHQIFKSIPDHKKPTLFGSGSFNRIRYAYDDSINGIEYLRNIAKIFKNKNIIHVSGYEPFVNPTTGEKQNLISKEYFSLSKSVHWLPCPKNNSFDNYDEILKECLNLTKNYSRDSILFHLSFGPAASVLSMELCSKGYQSIDAGQYHLLENLQKGIV